MRGITPALMSAKFCFSSSRSFAVSSSGARMASPLTSGHSWRITCRSTGSVSTARSRSMLCSTPANACTLSSSALLSRLRGSSLSVIPNAPVMSSRRRPSMSPSRVTAASASSLAWSCAASTISTNRSWNCFRYQFTSSCRRSVTSVSPSLTPTYASSSAFRRSSVSFAAAGYAGGCMNSMSSLIPMLITLNGSITALRVRLPFALIGGRLPTIALFAAMSRTSFATPWSGEQSAARPREERRRRPVTSRRKNATPHVPRRLRIARCPNALPSACPSTVTQRTVSPASVVTAS